MGRPFRFLTQSNIVAVLRQEAVRMRPHSSSEHFQQSSMTNEAYRTKIVLMEMLGRHLKDLFAAIIHCYQNELLMPCLVLVYSGIDVAASLEPSSGNGVGERFEKWVDRYMLQGNELPCTARELYAARCAVVHTYTPDSNLSKAGKARVIGYAYGKADVNKLDKATVRANRQAGQVNVHMEDLIEAFHSGYETYFKEALADTERRKEVMKHANIWTTSMATEKIDAYLAVTSANPANAKMPSK